MSNNSRFFNFVMGTARVAGYVAGKTELAIAATKDAAAAVKKADLPGQARELACYAKQTWNEEKAKADAACNGKKIACNNEEMIKNSAEIERLEREIEETKGKIKTMAELEKKIKQQIAAVDAAQAEADKAEARVNELNAKIKEMEDRTN